MTDREVMQQALEALKKATKHLPVHFDSHFEAITALRAALEQQQAEPVAWMSQAGNFLSPLEFTTADAALYGWTPVYTTTPAPQRKPLTEEQDANRYRWLRDRLQVRYMQALSGQKRRGLVMRVGHGFLDSKTPPERGWKDPRYFDECRQEVDAAIDAAIEQAHGIGEKP